METLPQTGRLPVPHGRSLADRSQRFRAGRVARILGPGLPGHAHGTRAITRRLARRAMPYSATSPSTPPAGTPSTATWKRGLSDIEPLYGEDPDGRAIIDMTRHEINLYRRHTGRLRLPVPHLPQTGLRRITQTGPRVYGRGGRLLTLPDDKIVPSHKTILK